MSRNSEPDSGLQSTRMRTGILLEQRFSAEDMAYASKEFRLIAGVMIDCNQVIPMRYLLNVKVIA
jgi:hypothetical protein